MSQGTAAVPDRLREMRLAFDTAFAEPVRPPAESLVPLLLIRAGGEALALPSLQVTELLHGRGIVPLPSRDPELLGIAGIRGALVPVFHLARLLGGTWHEPRPRWLVLVRREATIGLAFDELENYSQAAPACFYQDQNSPARRHVRQLVRLGSSVRGVVEIAALVEAVQRREFPQQKESFK